MWHKRRVIALLGGHIIEDPQSGQFRTARFNETRHGIIGDSLRGEATAVLFAQQPLETIVVAVGGVTPIHKIEPEAPHLSTVLKQELIGLGINEANIVELDIDPGYGTAEQLMHIAKLLDQSPYVEELFIVSNRWHLTRVWALMMFQDELQRLNDRCPRTMLMAAEDVLITFDSERWQESIVTMYRLPAMRHVLRMELQGASQIAEGTYHFSIDVPDRSFNPSV